MERRRWAVGGCCAVAVVEGEGGQRGGLKGEEAHGGVEVAIAQKGQVGEIEGDGGGIVGEGVVGEEKERKEKGRGKEREWESEVEI